MATFTDFDSRGYRMVDARTGYGEWVATYEGTVEDAMDIALLERLTTPRWETVREAVDLGCGTGRTGAWLRSRGVEAIDGVDLTPEMLERARTRGARRRAWSRTPTTWRSRRWSTSTCQCSSRSIVRPGAC
jgi:trans-aconitate methyltransferase